MTVTAYKCEYEKLIAADKEKEVVPSLGGVLIPSPSVSLRKRADSEEPQMAYSAKTRGIVALSQQNDGNYDLKRKALDNTLELCKFEIDYCGLLYREKSHK